VGGDEPRPWWDRALDVLRHEEVAFRMLMWVAGGAAVVIAVALVVRAL
jgi:hypothetical protein